MTTVVSDDNTFSLHPMKGPFTTRTLRSIAGTNPLHWRGDIADFTGFNQAFSSLLGGNQLSASDMSAYEAFVNTVALMPNPNQNLDRSLPTNLNGGNAINGRNEFLNVTINGQSESTCNACHNSNPGPGSSMYLVNRSNLAQPMKITTLRNVYQKLNFANAAGARSIDGFGLGSDGSMSNFAQILAQPVLGGFANDPQAQADVGAFLVSFDTGYAPAVGYTRTITTSNVSSSSITADWTMLQSQAAAAISTSLPREPSAAFCTACFISPPPVPTRLIPSPKGRSPRLN